ncbi:PREDICTED: autophagy-related protein 18e [Tarenaya hassleriana]|uniref:autophagy-related protein 18e n=1 Tax=Tarenaya hassleriana TaxID=28532 RepID=UPI0008FD0B9F|nr:PREDICTED: autophagy-related protein 18e [Tarenaya hassleriana]
MDNTVSTPRGMLSLSKAETSGSLRNCGSDETGELKVLSVTWNQDCSCFTAGTNRGFCVYTSKPFKESRRHDLKGCGFKIVEMLFQSHLFALVGDGSNDTLYPSNKVWIWDDHQDRCHCELAFRSEVVSVKLQRDCIVVVLQHKIYVYSFNDLKVQRQIETIMNPKGLCCISHHVTANILACPGLDRGQVQVHDLGRKTTKIIDAHDSAVACMTLTLDGTLLATASTKGTLIRIFNAMDGTRLQELRRGAEKAAVYSIAISQNLKWAAASSDRGTVHVFHLNLSIQSLSPTAVQNRNSSDTTYPSTNPGSSLSFMRGVLPKYFHSERSFAQFSLPESTKFIAGFGSENTLLLVGMNGSFLRCRFDPVGGGKMLELEHKRFSS